MSDIYLYDAEETDFDNIGLCGALLPNEAKFSEIANGNATLTLTHPRDEYGKFALIERGMILKAAVPVRTTPEITNGEFVTTVYEYTVSSTATKEQRKIWNTRDKTKQKRKCLKVAAKGDTIVVVKTFDNQNYFTKVKYTYKSKKKNKTVTGFIDPAALQGPAVSKVIPATPAGMDSVADSWNVKDQLFRIENVEKTESEVNVTAHHISYDFMYNLTSYNFDGSETLQEALDGVFGSCFEEHGFDAQTNITSTLTGFHYADKDPITAMMDPDIGLVPRFDGELVRDNYMFTVLDHAGTNRGYRIEYGKNMTGISWQIDETSIAGAIRPYGETKKGNKLYLDHSYIANDDYTSLTQVSGDDKGLVYSPRYYTYTNGTLTSTLPYTRIYAFQGDDCKATVGPNDDPEASDITEAMVRTRLKDQSLKALKDGADVPEVSISVDIKQLGNSVQYADFAELEKVFLFDTVLVYHRRMGILADAVVSAIEWDVIQDELVGITLGTIRDLSQSVASWQIVQINGGKIMPSTIPGSAILPGTISAEKIIAKDITADLIAANTITADKIYGNYASFTDLVAQNLTAQDIRAEMVEAGEGYFGSVVAGNLTNETMRSKLASISVLDAAQAMLGNTVIDSATFKDAFTAYLNVDHLFVNDLWLKDSQQQLRQIEVDATTGAVKAGSLLANKTINGSTLILDSSINAAQLNANEIFANSAIIAALTASSIWSSEGWIAQLRAASVSGNGFLQLSSGNDYNTYIQETDPQTQGLELNVGDVWVRINSDKYQCRTWGGSAWEVVGDDSTNEPHGSTPPTNPSYLTIWVDVAHNRVWRYWDDNWHEFGGSHTFNSTENPGRSVVRSNGSASIRQYSHPRVGDIWNDPKEGVSYKVTGSRRWVLTGRMYFYTSTSTAPTQRASGVPLEIGDIWKYSGVNRVWNGAGWEQYTSGVYTQDSQPTGYEGWIWCDTDAAYVTVATGITTRPVYEYTRWRRFTTKTFKQTFEPYGELIDGDTWINGSTVYTYNGSAWQREQYSYYQSTEPANPKQGEVWCDSTTGRTYTWSGSAWVRTKPYATSGSRAPTDPAPINGDTWFCTETYTSGGYTYYAGCSYEYGGGWKVRNGELHNSTVNITPQLVSIKTPAFQVDIQHTDSAETTELRVDGDGVAAEIISANQTIAAPAVYADNVPEAYAGPTMIQANEDDIDTILESLNGKHLNEDVIVKLGSYNWTNKIRPTLHDISGAKLIITANNLLCNPWYTNASGATAYYTGKNYRCTSSGDLNSMTLTNSSASTNNYRMFYLGNVGSMGLHGKEMRFCTKAYGNGYSRYQLIVGKPMADGSLARTTAWFEGALQKGTTSSNAVVNNVTLRLDHDKIDNMDDCEMFFTLWCGSSSDQTAANTSVTYINTVLEIGSEFGSTGTDGMSDKPGNGAGLQFGGCDIRDCSSQIVFTHVNMTQYSRIVNSNVSFNICRFPAGVATSASTVTGAASIEQLGGDTMLHNCVGGNGSNPFALVRGGSMTIEGAPYNLDGNQGFRPAGTTTGNVTVIGSPTTSGGGAAPDTETSYTNTFKAVDHDTYWGSWASSDDDLRTGSISAHANMVGWCTFNTSTIPANAVVTAATLKIKRMSGYGVSGKVDLKIRKSSSTTKPSGAPGETGTAITLNDFISEGETKKANVKDLVSVNARSAFVFKVDDESVMTDRAYSANFARYKGSALELTVTYTV